MSNRVILIFFKWVMMPYLSLNNFLRLINHCNRECRHIDIYILNNDHLYIETFLCMLFNVFFFIKIYHCRIKLLVKLDDCGNFEKSFCCAKHFIYFFEFVLMVLIVAIHWMMPKRMRGCIKKWNKNILKKLSNRLCRQHVDI